MLLPSPTSSPTSHSAVTTTATTPPSNKPDLAQFHLRPLLSLLSLISYPAQPRQPPTSPFTGEGHALSNTLESPQLENVNLEIGHSGSTKLLPEPGECSFRFSSLVKSMKQLLHFRKYKKVIELKEI
ncbi:hypothetical protein L2E82_24710 [Cichorium intybus]|uniref:Uncharacterized protein n=1 Tax=Cichorium intybus TaxID=13427 RepID=A0ACB9E1T4_CICIN|nr:hypothetical protein L2E82_24710 [Cichorium intybus]